MGAQTLENAQSNFTQKLNEFKLEVSNTYADKATTESDIAELQETTQTVSKYMTFGNDYLVIGTNANRFNVQITNTAINFRNGEQVLAYMTNEKLFITESEVTQSMRIGKYQWMLPGSTGAVALIYTGT